MPFYSTKSIKQIGPLIKSGKVNYWTGDQCKKFEHEFYKYLGNKYSLALSNGSVALEIALRALKLKKKDNIIVTPRSFIISASCTLNLGLKPIFADVDDTLCLDPKSVFDKINKKTKAIIFVGIGGNAGSLDKISKICKEKNIVLILDAAHMSGTFVNPSSPIHVGHEADVTIFSFQAVKNLPTADSGMICFKEKRNLDICKKLSWLGIDKNTFSRSNSKGGYRWDYDVPYLGFKYHGNSIMASMALIQLKYLDEDNNRRNEICSKYDSLLSGIDSINSIVTSDYTFKSSRHLYQIYSLEHSREVILENFYKKNIFPGVHYKDNRQYLMYKSNSSLPNVDKYSDKIISLPLHLEMSDDDISKVADKLLEMH